jgi:hypothetical protein
MSFYVKNKAVIDGLTDTQVGLFPTKKQAELFVRSAVGCENVGMNFKKCIKIANKIAMLTETHKKLSDGSWMRKSMKEMHSSKKRKKLKEVT